MLHRIAWLRLFSLAVLLSGAGLPAAAAQDDAPRVLATFTFPDVPVASLQNELLPGYPIADDRGILIGGVGSDLWRGPEDAAGEFWLVTDRGPNGEIKVNGKNRRTFPVPEFTPLILHVTVADGDIAVLDAIPIVNQRGEPVTGLPNLEDDDETPYDFAAAERLDLNQNGLDVEGMVRTAAGEFWIADEYRPSLLKLDAAGKVVVRFVPEGVDLPDAGYPVADTLPAAYAGRKQNRGFEGLALSGDEQTLYAALQSPLPNDDEDPDEASLAGRILAIDAASGRPVAEYICLFDEASGFDCTPDENTCDPSDLKLSGLVWHAPGRLLVLERTDQDARLYLADLTTATDVLGSDWDDPDRLPVATSRDELADLDVTPPAKTEWINLDDLADMPDKIEGVAIIDSRRIAVINDNDFALGGFDGSGQLVESTGVASQLLIIAAPPVP